MVPWQTGEEEMTAAFLAALVELVFLAALVPVELAAWKR